jgi:predicted nucleotide-binding protein
MAAKKKHVFISYSRKDIEIMKAIIACLDEFTEIPVWVDVQDIQPTAKWMQDVGKAIEKSKLVILLMSPDAKKSDWVNNEVAYAGNYNKPIIPLLIRGRVPRYSILLAVAAQSYIDMRKEILCDKLIQAIVGMK